MGRKTVGRIGPRVVAFVMIGSLVAGVSPALAAPEGAQVAFYNVGLGRWSMAGIGEFYYGASDDHPMLCDWNGDGIDTVGLYRKQTGYLYLRQQNSFGVADISFHYGNPADLPVCGDWNGDGIDTIGIYRPSEATFYLRNSNQTGFADIKFGFSSGYAWPVAGDWDGDGVDTVGLWHPSNGYFELTSSNTSAVGIQGYLGAAGDRVVAADFDQDGQDTIGVYRPSNGVLYLSYVGESNGAPLEYAIGSGSGSPVAGVTGGTSPGPVGSGTGLIDQGADSPSTSLPTGGNPCPEGQFQDLRDSTCKPLAKSLGFQRAQFDAARRDKTLNLSACTTDAVQTALETLESNGGGTLIIPACTLTVSSTFYPSSNVTIKGSGIDKTKLEPAPDFTGKVFDIRGVKNVVVSDLEIAGDSRTDRNIWIWKADNVLVERVHVHHSRRTGINIRYSKNVTVRYSESSFANVTDGHGIGNKDCFPSTSTPDAVECVDQAGDVGPGAVFSNSLAYYSNKLIGNGGYGLDSHGDNVEAAGNLIESNTWGTKWPDANHVWIHDNRIRANDNWGSQAYSLLGDPSQQGRDIVWYRNDVIENGLGSTNETYGFRVEDVSNVYFINNNFQNNGLGNAVRVTSAAEAYICSGSQEATLLINNATLISGTKCALGNVSRIFDPLQ